MTNPNGHAEQSPAADDAGRRLESPDVGLVVVRGASIRSLGYVAGLALNAAGSVLLLRYLPVEQFGRYMTVAALIAIVAGVSEAGLTMVGLRQIALRPAADARRRLVSSLLGIRLALTTVGVAVAVGFAAIVGYDETLVAGTCLMGIGLLLTSTQTTMTLPLSGELAMGRLTASELTRQVVTVVGIGAIVLLEGSLLAFFSVQIVVGAVLLTLTPVLVRPFLLVWRPSFDRREWAELLRLALPLAVSATIAVFYFRLLVVLSSLLSTDYETGLLATSFRVIELLYGLGAVAASVALPVLAATAADHDRLRYMAQRMTEVALVAGSYLAILVFAVADPVLDLLGGSEYEAAGPVLQIQVFALIAAFLSQVWLSALTAIGRLGALAFASAAGLVVSAGLGVVLIESNGAEGAAVAAVAGESVLALVLLVLLGMARPARRLDLLALWKGAAAGAAMLAVVLLLDAGPWLDAVAGTAVFVLVVATTRAVPPEVLDAFRRRRGGHA